MPPHDCIGYVGPLFFRMDNGEYVPFPGIQEMTLPKVDDPAYAQTIRTMNTCETFSAEMKLTYRSVRKFYKMVHADINQAKRKRRRFKRQKEKARRNTLKYGGNNEYDE